MAVINFNGSGIDFSGRAYSNLGVLYEVDEIYSYVITRNSSSRLSLYGYLNNGYTFDMSLELSSRRNYTLRLKV